MMGFSRSFSILMVSLLGASSCSATTPRVLKTNTHCIRANDQPLCPGEEMHLDSDTVKIAAGFPDNSRLLTTWTPFWEETLWIGSHSKFDLPGFDKSMKNIFLGDDSCLYGNVGWNVFGGFLTTNAQLIKCVNEHYDGQPYPNPWAEKNYGPAIAEAQLDLSEPAHNKKGASVMDYRTLPQREGDPDEKLPAYNGWNPFLRGVHQNSQWPQHYPLHYDPTGPKKNRHSSGESAVDRSNDAAKTDGTVVGVTAGTPVASTGDTTATSTDSAAASTSGTVTLTDGSVASTDGTVTPADGTIASTDGTAASTGGSVASTDITVASSLTTDTTPQDLTAQAVPSDDALSFGKKSRRSFLHPRDFRVQMQ